MKSIIALVSVIGLLLPTMTLAQSTLYVSNLGQTSTGIAAIGSDSWIAQSIVSGTNSSGYVLNSVQLLMNAASGSPSGFNVSIYSSLSGLPYNNLGNLVGSDPSAGGLFTYAASDLDLSPSTFYFVVVTAATPVAQGSYIWSGEDGPYSIGEQQWAIPDSYNTSPDGSSWTRHIRLNIPQLGIYATAVPEPTTLALAGLGLACMSLLRRRR